MLSLPRKMSESYTKVATRPPQTGAMMGAQSQYWSLNVKTKRVIVRQVSKQQLAIQYLPLLP